MDKKWDLNLGGDNGIIVVFERGEFSLDDFELTCRAKIYIEKLANGINPLTDDNVPEGDIVNNVKISRCLFFVADVLEKVIENGVCVKTTE